MVLSGYSIHGPPATAGRLFCTGCHNPRPPSTTTGGPHDNAYIRTTAVRPHLGTRRTTTERRRQCVPASRLDESVEDRLFAACDRLDDLKPPPWSRLDWDKVDEIRTRAAAGESQQELAAAFGISIPLCCQVIKGRVWTEARRRSQRKASLMRLRLMMAFDSGARRQEMMRVQLKHIDFNPIRITVDGRPRELLVIELQSKGEKFTGEKERVYAGTERLITALRGRRDELQNNPNGYVFGTSSGFRQENFRAAWHRLFKLAGLDCGRDKGLVCHTLRHEFCSRTAENTGDPVVAQELARHKDLRTTQGYLHARRPRVLAAAVSLDRQFATSRMDAGFVPDRRPSAPPR